jgi:tetratricopeptide (TPR) repeat protein
MLSALQSKMRNLGIFVVIALSMALSGWAQAENNLIEPWKITAIELVRPIQSETLELLFQEADSLYQSKRFQAAQDSLKQLLELEPRLAAAWFRLGNTWQQIGRMDWAIHAYQEAARGDSYALKRQPEQISRKALLNLANFYLSNASDVIEKLEAFELHDEPQLVQVRQKMNRMKSQKIAIDQMAVKDSQTLSSDKRRSNSTRLGIAKTAVRSRASALVPVQMISGQNK